jgi:hypothetical protein
MSAHPLHAAAGDDAHREAQEALPWLANGSLAGTELERVQAHLQACAACRADLAALHTLRAAGEVAPPYYDADAGLGRLMAQLDTSLDASPDAPQPVLPPAPAAPAQAPGGWRGRLAANDPRWLRAAVALQCCAIAVLAGLLLRAPGGADADDGAYRVLGADAGAQGRLVVAFRPDTPERELRRLVLDSGARIVGGPTAGGAWVLAADGEPAAGAAVKALRALAAVLVFGLCAPAWAGAPADDVPDPVAEAARHQVLVMLRLPAQHFRPDAAYGGGYLKDGGSAARRRLAGAIAQAHGLRLRDSWAMPAIGVDCFVMEDGGAAPLERVLDELAHDARVAWAQPLADFHALDAGDPLYPVQPAANDWRLAELHRASTGRNVAVAVVDSGVDAAHPDLAGRIAVRRNFVDDGPDVAERHGTAVAGIIGARSGNGVGIAGVAPGAKLMALRACWETGNRPARCNSLTLGKAINYALENDARVINLSLAGPADRLLQSLLQAAVARGVVVVGAADPQRPDGGFPASFSGVIGVARTGDRHPAPAPLFYAPGTDVPTCAPGAGWDLVSGSSYAAAHVAGLAALLAELKPGGGAKALRRRLDGGVQAAVAGNIDACAALSRAADACVCQCTQTAATTLSPAASSTPLPAASSAAMRPRL